MIRVNPSRLALAITAALAFAGCGSSSNSKPAATTTIGPAGGSLTAGAATLTIPAGALSTPTQVTLREAEPHHAGRAVRAEVEPHGQALATPARLAIRFDDANAKVKMVDDAGTLAQVEMEDRNHGGYKTSMSHLGEIEVELEHGTACAPACVANQECDDGVCKAHVEHPEAKGCDPVCDFGKECDDGVCKLHSEMEPGGTPGTATCMPHCASGYLCDNGVCKP